MRQLGAANRPGRGVIVIEAAWKWRKMRCSRTGQRSDLGLWVKGSQINRDRDLRLQYLAGWGINSRLEDQIYRDMLRYRRPPDNLFSGSPDRVQSLNYAISSEPGY